MNKAWWKAANRRALKTAAQSLAPSVPATVTINAMVPWFSVGYAILSIVGTAALMALSSYLTSIAGLPELKPPQ